MPQLPDFAFRVLGAAMAAFRFPRLRRADPPPVGLAFPLLRPLMLGGESWDRQGLLDATLIHGDPLDDSAPLVEITTCFQDLNDLAPEQALGGLAHRDEAIRRGDWRSVDNDAGADPPGPVTFSEADIIIEGKRCAVTVLTFGTYQAACFVSNGVAGTLASRHFAINQIILAWVPAVEPYLDGYRAFLLRMARHRRTRPGRTLALLIRHAAPGRRL
jgi:hypothetical protein